MDRSAGPQSRPHPRRAVRGDIKFLIRTITAQGSTLSFRAGAGIVADSSPAHELAETRAKAEGLLRALRAGPAA